VAENEETVGEQGATPPDDGIGNLPVPFEGYEELTAKDVVKRLESSDPDTKAAVLAYEEANQNRSTVVTAASPEQADNTYPDDQLSRQQIIERAPELLTNPDGSQALPFAAEIAIKRFFAGGDFLTVEEAQKALDDFNANQIETAEAE
jgi:hypothetical protein